ncbi:ATP12 family chaperone protein [Afifella sp. IM 167]|uniref:ATP12 family chaperone protein n=1 Tax=Afifella sp. IM 167 TaxID=2033586 RepID=UPI001CCCB0FE|nr:ATP12 family protein [Afifella sp. IM 167]MBZ8134578.1 ATPase [Afifella sp. IM 167]
MPETADTDNPILKAQRLTQPVLPKRFYKSAEAVEAESGFELRLDGRSARTPARRALAVPRPEQGARLAAEWNAQGEHIDPATMPFTRLANVAIDGVADAMEAVRAQIGEYAGTDLIFYRAGEPEELVARQRAAWDPVLVWAEGRFGARFALVEGVMPVDQPEPALAAIAAELDIVDEPLKLAALHTATTLTGSALIALALAEGALDGDAAWAAAHVDEDFNISRWGEDFEARRRREARQREFSASVFVLQGA